MIQRTVNPAADVVLPHTYTPRGAKFATAWSIWKYTHKKELIVDTSGQNTMVPTQWCNGATLGVRGSSVLVGIMGAREDARR